MGRGAVRVPLSHTACSCPRGFSHLNLREGWAWRWETLAWNLAARPPGPPRPDISLPRGLSPGRESLVSPLWKGWFRGHSESPAGLERLFPRGWFHLRPSFGRLEAFSGVSWLMPRPGTGRLRAERAFVLVLLSLCPPPLPRGTGRWGLPSERCRGGSPAAGNPG